ncbi:MAG: hypothetical protein H6807_07305 [Planctomycetes bacterium]|nr:hypothetical protein [Planctomycetota bacterium]
MKTRFGTIIALLVAATLQVAATAQSVSLPYSQNFDNLPVGNGWSMTTTGPGRVVFGTPPSASPISGNNAILMDGTMNGVAYTNTVTLKVDLAGASGCRLSYWAREASDEPDAADGLFISDGNQTVLAYSHTSLTSTWIQIQIDVGQVLATNGMTTGGVIDIIWSQADNYPIPTDGLCVDDVVVLPPPVPDSGQANQVDAALDVNGGLNLNLQPASIGINGPFFASGNVVQIAIDGPTSWPFALLLGPLNRNNAVFPGIGSLDIGMLGAGNYADILLIMDGANPVGFFDYFAYTDATGQANLSFDLTGLPSGVLGTFQALVYQPASPFFKLTAAFEYSLP